jgi:putative ABC transport system permease protein
MDTIDISVLRFSLGLLLLFLPIAILGYFRTGLVKDSVISSVRMVVQLLLTGLYLEFLFEQDNAWLNTGWVMIMLMISATTIVQRTGLKMKVFLWPVLAGLCISLLLTTVLFLGLIVGNGTLVEARYLIPISGMILGNGLEYIIVSLNAHYSDVVRSQAVLRFRTGNGATQQEALKPFMRDAMVRALNPTIAKMSVMGLIALPGTMTGQIIGGSSPIVAIKYQIMIMVIVLASSALSVYLSMELSNRVAFDAWGNLKPGLIKERKNGKKNAPKK